MDAEDRPSRRRLRRRVALAIALGAASACAFAGAASERAVAPDASGYLRTGPRGEVRRATTTVAEAVDLRRFNSLALVTVDDFAAAQIRLLKVFGEVIDLPELQRRIVAKDLQDKIPALKDRIGLNNVARHYGNFLWIHSETTVYNNATFVQLIATDPSTLNDVFRAAVESGSSIGDPNTFYPLFNSLSDWARRN